MCIESKFYEAIINNDIENVKKLIEDGIDVNIVFKKKLEFYFDESTSFNDDTYLTLAVIRGYKKIAEILIKNGADINAKDKNGKTVLSKIISVHYNKEKIEYLLQNGADINTKNSDGETALSTAVYFDYSIEKIEYLLQNGADINTKNSDGETALSTAVYFDHSIEKIEYLLQKGANVHSLFSRSAYYRLVRGQRIELIELLIKYEFDVNEKDNNGDSLLIEAIVAKNLKIVEILIKNGADINTRDVDGANCTALIVATYMNAPDIVKYLIVNGADIDSVDDYNMTAMQYAKRERNKETKKLFRIEYIKQNPNSFKYASNELKADKEFVLEVVKHNGALLKYASLELKNDFEVVSEALKNSKVAYEFVGEILKNDKRLNTN